MEIKSYRSYLLPSLIATVFLSTYVIFDGIFIGIKLSDLGLSAINIGWPVVAILHSLGIGLGISAGIYISIKNGEGKIEDANKAKLTSIIILFVLALSLSLILFIFRKPLLYLFGADDIVYPYADEYLTNYLLFGGIVYVLGPALVQLLKNSGKARIAMIASISAIIVNFTLDYLFIIQLDMGLKGASLASVSGQAVACIISFIAYFKELKGVSFNKHFIKRFFLGGLAPYVLNFSYDIILVITNRVCGYFNGNEAIATYALLTYVLYVVNSICQGVGDGIQPMFSYYVGKKDYKYLKK
ncbi:MAG: polysaccharide biosynthesis C-terminal domain-containing protein, partial [Acholeplasmatales bacterium]|nr:polysaccharide biosynthesis C-terminal domain-containing protein [Acholeplasmatales bacterium]